MFGNELTFSSWANGYVERPSGITNLPGIQVDFSNLANFTCGGKFIVECIDDQGNQVWKDTAKNMVTNAGITMLLNVMFLGSTASTSWYLGIIDNNGFSALAAGDTMSSHAGWSELASGNTSDTNRIQWSPGSPNSGAIVNGTSSDYHMIPSSTITVYGVFLVDNNTKGGSSGNLFATAAFSTGPQQCKNGDTLRTTYTMSAASN